MAITDKVLDELLQGYEKPEDLLGPHGVFAQLKKALADRVLQAELTHHLTEEAREAAPGTPRNHRNGATPKTVLTESGPMEVATPRDRAGTFTPQFIPKHARRLVGFDAKVLSMYARGMTTREIGGHLEELYGTTVSPALITTVTDAVLDEVSEWQHRPLAPLYPVIFFDAMRVKIRDEGTVRNKAVYLAIGVGPDGTKEVLGLWMEQTEGAKFWLRVMNELKNRGVEDVLFAVVDGLRGFPDAITTVFPLATVQTCVVHLIRHSLAFTNWTDRKSIARDLKAIYQAPTAAAAGHALDAFAAGPWGQKYPPIAAAWRRQWEQVIPFFVYPSAIRKVIYTTNAIESLHSMLRKILKTRGHFPTDEAATKLIYLTIRNITKRWTSAAHNWKEAMTQFAMMYPDRFTFNG